VPTVGRCGTGREQVSRFRFVEDHQRAVGVKWLCRVPQVSRSGFYRCRSAAPARAARQEAEDRLVEGISTIHAESGGAHGDLGCTAAMSVTCPAPAITASQ
jgi:hypothetical protein